MEEIAPVNSPTTTDTLLLPPPPPPPPPSSSETSPSHEFSFTITFHSPPATSPPLAPPSSDTCATTTSATAIASSAADDDIFLGCQLLPLHHLLPPPSPPRPSDITFEHFALASLDRGDDAINKTPNRRDEVRGKARSLLSSFFGLANSRKKASEGKVCEAKAEAENGKKKSRGLGGVSRLLKKYYASVKEPLQFFRGDKEKEKEKERGREKKEEVLRWRGFRRRPCSFSGDAGCREQGKRGKQHRRKTEQVLSAPNSARTSRANSGALAAAPSSAFSSSDGSTMEELQSAIQAAIAHCKSSLANSKQQQQGNGNLAMVRG
ncbi:probable BRI1 kinase inhibitor 1 [Zingiber officinale]|uniref:Membrane-associated kinase regulator 1 n=1 Tax=Zingiber officinale TaxID=94328 RepID=A0A8J5HIV5_ZINOF|nr:probable BRI1 kinase inhibitor 1 [Zingiber officinale]KAG6518035.1 hypothetical protein ZIOFF_021436 [Zingiber officinale]